MACIFTVLLSIWRHHVSIVRRLIVVPSMQTVINSQIIENQPVQKSMLAILCHLHNNEKERKKSQNPNKIGSDDDNDKSDKRRRRRQQKVPIIRRWVWVNATCFVILLQKLKSQEQQLSIRRWANGVHWTFIAKCLY